MSSKPVAVLIGFDNADVDEEFYTPLIATGPDHISGAGELRGWLMKRVPTAPSWPALWVHLEDYGKAYLRFPPRDQNGHPLYVRADIRDSAIIESFPATGELEIRMPEGDFRAEVEVGINLILCVHLGHARGEIWVGIEIPEEEEPEERKEPRDFVYLWMKPSRGERKAEAYLDAPWAPNWKEGMICVAGFRSLGVAILPPGILEEAMGVLGELGISLVQPQR